MLCMTAVRPMTSQGFRLLPLQLPNPQLEEWLLRERLCVPIMRSGAYLSQEFPMYGMYIEIL